MPPQDPIASDPTLRETPLASPLPSSLAAALVGRYRVERSLGAGGMATVYLAEDVRHHRKVAIKVLHPELSAVLGPERFLNEIELTASFQHPHILPLFDSGSADGLLYYVMPYVEGETLRERLNRETQLPIPDALRIVGEVADALDYAHRRGIIHRDVKPENILLHDGHVVVADFGIALAVRSAGGQRITQTGLSLGTPQYMAPEQAAAEKIVDHRADVYALGAVLYEMLGGGPPFTGPTAQAVIARLMTEEPQALTLHRHTVPPHVERAVRTALAKLPADRFTSAGAFAAALAQPVDEGEAAGPHVERTARGRGFSMPVVAALGAVVLAAGLAIGTTIGRRALATGAAAHGPVRFVIDVDSGGFLGAGSWYYSSPAISPDGRTVVYAATGPSGPRLFARSADDIVSHPIAGTEGGDWPFFSPDGAWVGFESRGLIRKVRLDGGTPVTVAELPQGKGMFFGGAWLPGDTIVYTVFFSGKLYRVPAAGGTPTPIPLADTTRHLLYPSPLPGGRMILVTSSLDWRVGRIAVLDLATGTVRRFDSGVGARYVAGHIVYAGAGGALYRQRFDLDRMAPSGPAEEVANGLDTWFAGYSPLDVSSSGSVVYRIARGMELAIVDRAGREVQVIPGRYPWSARFSPDGRRLAFSALTPGREGSDMWSGDVWHTDILIADLTSGTTQPLTADGNDNNEPVWSPDGRAIAFDAGLLGTKDLYVRALDGDSTRLLVRAPGSQVPGDWALDGRILFGNRGGVWAQPMPTGVPSPFLTDQNVGELRVSKDGRWIAYESYETGRSEIFVRSYPSLGAKTQVSVGGGAAPAWRKDGRELYYWQGTKLVAVSLDPGGAGQPPVVRAGTTLFEAVHIEGADYDVSPDGSRFVFVRGGPRTGRLVVALDALGIDRTGR
ncbi:MAG TPA: protein kinase [Gemmatimonadaceae bacterium]